MKHLITILIALYSFAINAQESNLVFFSEQGEKFKVFLNGVAQNESFTSNVKVTGLNQPYYKARIVFEDRSKGEIDKTLNFNPNTETVFRIKLAKRGYVLRWQSEVPMAQAAPASPDQTSIVYHSEPLPATQTQAATQSSNSEVRVETTQTTETEPQNASISINMPEVKMNVSMKVNEQMGNIRSNSSTTTTTTTTTSSSSGDVSNMNNMSEPAQPTQSQPDRYNMPGYNGPYGCNWPAGDGDFNSVKQSIKSKTFRDDKITVYRQILRSKCFTTNQVKEIVGLFTFEDDKVEVAKMSYDKTFDQGNYYKINDAFTYSSSIDELNEYLDSK